MYILLWSDLWDILLNKTRGGVGEGRTGEARGIFSGP